MAPSPDPSQPLLHCARAIQHRDTKLVDSLLHHIWKLAVDRTNEYESTVLKFYAEALVRRAYGLHPHPRDFFFQIPPYDESYFDRVDRVELKGKKRWHIIDFYMPRLYGFTYLFRGLADRSLLIPVPVRVSVILPPFLEKTVDVQQEQQYLTWNAKLAKIELTEFKVIYANSLDDASITTKLNQLDLRRTEDEAVVVFYNGKLHKLLAEAGAIERELLKLRQIHPEIVFVVEPNANRYDSNFIERVEHSFSYFEEVGSHYSKRRVIEIMVGCESRERIERHLTLNQWQSHFRTAGFLPLPLNKSPYDLVKGIREENGFMVHMENPSYFISAWKYNPLQHFNSLASVFLQGTYL